MADAPLRLKIAGKDYSVDFNDLELGEVAAIEDVTGLPIGQIDFNSAKALMGLVFVMRRRDDASFTLADAGTIKFSAVEEADEPEKKAKPKRPTAAATSG